MKVAVWDTYVTKKDGSIMNFDIITPAEMEDSSTIYKYGGEYLKTKGQAGQALTSEQCRFCHVENARPQWEQAIASQGYYIIEMENCY
jgi:Domain of unknown function (DUF2024)